MTAPIYRRVAGFAFLAASPALLSALAGGGIGTWSAIGAAFVLAGLTVIRFTRGRWLSAPFIMLLLSTVGMALGLSVDRLSAGPAALATLCGTEFEPLSVSVAQHWDLLRATNIAMVLGGLATVALVELRARRSPTARCRKAICARAGFNLACNLTMVSGMLLGAWLGPLVAARLGLGWGIAGMMTVMTAGMVWGVAGSMALARVGSVGPPESDVPRGIARAVAP